MAVEVDQGSAGQSSRLDGDPEQSHVLADDHQAHGGEEEKHASDEDALRRIREELPFLEIATRPRPLTPQIADGVKGRGEKQDAGDREKDETQRVEPEPFSGTGSAARDQAGDDDSCVGHGGGHQQRPAQRVGAQQEGQHSSRRRQQHQGEHLHGTSLRLVSRSTSIESNSRWM
jgi:hypothetical protein